MATARPFHTLLVANRGEIAVRVIEAARGAGLATIAVYAEPDRAARHVRLADRAIALGDGTLQETYLDGARIVELALAHGADAVHPGYGFLSERADFARAVIDAGLVWVGPKPEAIAAMGDKLAAKELANRLGLPMLASVELSGDEPFEWRTQVGAVGYPLLVKAAAGGGGRGMRLVMSESQLDEAVIGARREAEASFGDGTVFAERWLAAPRHIEIQVVGDTHGNLVHLGERECSIQRRHQKLIEEAPSTAVDADLREAMGAAALRLSEAIGYDSVGTVEFLLDSDAGTFSFLEMNTRLQVEHRVTEAVTGVDLVNLQLAITAGGELDLEQDDVVMLGHSIEARLVAEDPSRDWLASTGTLLRLQDDDFGVVCDHGLSDGMEVTPHYDSLLAKAVSYGGDREQACRRLVQYLRHLEIHGITTNRDHLVAVLESEDFAAGHTTTAFVDLHPSLLDARPDHDTRDVHLVAATIGVALDRRERDPHWPEVPAGWRNVGVAWQHGRWQAHDEVVEVTYRAEGNVYDVEIDGRAMQARLIERDALALVVEIDGVSRRCRMAIDGRRVLVNCPAGQTELLALDRLPSPQSTALGGGTTAPVPGRVVGVEVAVDDLVAPGDTLVVMEAMKVEHRVTASGRARVVEVLVQVGDNVDAHEVLVRLEEIDG